MAVKIINPTLEQELANVQFRIDVISNRSMQGKGDVEKVAGWRVEREALLARKAEIQRELGVSDPSVDDLLARHQQADGKSYCAQCGGTWPCFTVRGEGWVRNL